MIFRNTFRLLLTNFSNVWKILVYYLICILLTIAVCWGILSPIIAKLTEAHVFSDLVDMLNNIFVQSEGIIAYTIQTLTRITKTAIEVITTNIQFKTNYILFLVWIFFVFPFTLDLAQLALGEVMYGYMTSQVKYSFTGRYIKNIGKSVLYCFVRYFVLILFNAGILALFYVMIKFFTIGNILYVLLDFVLFAILIAWVSLKHTVFACWMPAISVLNCSVVYGLKKNFKSVFKKIVRVYSNCLILVLCGVVVNFIAIAYTFGVGIILTLPTTALAFVCFQMVCYFMLNGMRFYVMPDVVISPKRLEEQDHITKLKYLV